MTNVNPNSIQIIPIDECTKIFEYDIYQKIEINRNQLVRIKHGNYEGDLAKVVYIEDPINKIYIELVPKIKMIILKIKMIIKLIIQKIKMALMLQHFQDKDPQFAQDKNFLMKIKIMV